MKELTRLVGFTSCETRFSGFGVIGSGIQVQRSSFELAIAREAQRPQLFQVTSPGNDAFSAVVPWNA